MLIESYSGLSWSNFILRFNCLPLLRPCWTVWCSQGLTKRPQKKPIACVGASWSFDFLEATQPNGGQCLHKICPYSPRKAIHILKYFKQVRIWCWIWLHFSLYGVDYLVKSVLLRFLNMTKNRMHRAHHPWLKCPGEFSPRSAIQVEPWGNTNGWGSQWFGSLSDNQRLGLSSAKPGDIRIIIYNQLYIYICVADV